MSPAGLLSREEAAERTLTTLRFFAQNEQSKNKEASGYRGFFYHFLDLETGKRYGNSELSTMDTALLMAGMLVGPTIF